MQNNISDVIESSGMSLADISKKYRIPYHTLQNWKYGKREPPEYISLLLSEAIEKNKIAK